MDRYGDILKNLRYANSSKLAIRDCDRILNSIPLKDATTYVECEMYERNYADIARLWLDKNPNEILINHKYLLTTNASYGIVKCQHGYGYDRQMFPATVISEV